VRPWGQRSATITAYCPLFYIYFRAQV